MSWFYFPPQQQHKSTLERFKSDPHKTRDPNPPGECHPIIREMNTSLKKIYQPSSGLLPHLLARQLPKSGHDGRQSGSRPLSNVDPDSHSDVDSDADWQHSNWLFFSVNDVESTVDTGDVFTTNAGRPGGKNQILAKKFFLTHCPRCREEEEVEVNSNSSSNSNRLKTQRKACSGKSQPALPRPPLTTRYQIKWKC